MGELRAHQYERARIVGRNYAYKPVVGKEPVDLGDFVSVEVTEARGGYLLGRTF